MEVNLTLQSRHRIYSSEYIQKSCKIIRVYMMPQEGLSEFVEMTLCDLYVVVEMQESHRKRHWGMTQEESWLVHSGIHT